MANPHFKNWFKAWLIPPKLDQLKPHYLFSISLYETCEQLLIYKSSSNTCEPLFLWEHMQNQLPIFIKKKKIFLKDVLNLEVFILCDMYCSENHY